ncbi:unnamed protein product [Hymenolepis diminuta]|uniref:Uncharacterized protein n=1 Tax=Hymenolepis diminuta TaxID=6216 RepID=A0A564XWD0_HYMDI|nr:unnamed protein product [Hymenolepis diminuta]
MFPRGLTQVNHIKLSVSYSRQNTRVPATDSHTALSSLFFLSSLSPSLLSLSCFNLHCGFFD